MQNRDDIPDNQNDVGVVGQLLVRWIYRVEEHMEKKWEGKYQCCKHGVYGYGEVQTLLIITSSGNILESRRKGESKL